MKVLLKIGGIKHLNEGRWEDALKYFDKIICVSLYNEEELGKTDKIEYIRMKRTLFNRVLVQTMRRIRHYKLLTLLNYFMLKLLRHNNKDMIMKLEHVDYTHILSSYCDYDASDISTLMIKQNLKNNIKLLRAYKETRPTFNYYERECFRVSDVLAFNSEENQDFFVKKYGNSIFEGKQIVTGWDENVLNSNFVNEIKYLEKYSDRDKKKHAVILAGRVLSSPKQARSGARLYYIDLIKDLISAGIVVHLHTNKIMPDEHNINRYKELENTSSGMFIIEPPLDMRNNFSEACSFLSQYDFGILHNFTDGSSVSVFDKINIPHRFYEYEAAHVIPILREGTTIVLEQMFKENKCGFIYKSFEDLQVKEISSIKYFIPTYSDYVENVILSYGGLKDEI